MSGSVRHIVHRTRGHTQGPITRLMSPGDLGALLKPFVFLDIFSVSDSSKRPFDLHPHSGIATVTVFTEGDARFDDGAGNIGLIAYGGVEWMRAGRGVWHGKEMSAGEASAVTGFQLWLALPPELELAAAESQYLEAAHIPAVGPARLIVGRYAGAASPVRSPAGVNYLMVTLKPGETWRYETPRDHTVGWLAVATGAVMLDAPVAAGEMIVLDASDGAIEMRATGEDAAKLVLGTAAPHPHDLQLGHFSVHTSRQALAEGEQHIRALRNKLIAREREHARVDGSVPILHS